MTSKKRTVGIPNRLYNIAKSQLDKAMDRWNEIDAKAQQEIDSFLASHVDTNQQSPWERALGKIQAGSAESELRTAGSQIPDTALLPPPDLGALEAKIAADNVGKSGRGAAQTPGQPPQLSPALAQERTKALVGAYKMLGIEPGADWPAVKTAYASLRERAAPERFPENSPERDTAASIQKRIDAAYMMVSGALGPSGDRFDRLEL